MRPAEKNVTVFYLQTQYGSYQGTQEQSTRLELQQLDTFVVPFDNATTVRRVVDAALFRRAVVLTQHHLFCSVGKRTVSTLRNRILL